MGIEYRVKPKAQEAKAEESAEVNKGAKPIKKRGRKPNPNTNSKYDRLETNLPSGTKALLEEYANQRGISVAKYVLESIMRNMDIDDRNNHSVFIIRLNHSFLPTGEEYKKGCSMKDPDRLILDVYQSSDLIEAVSYFSDLKTMINETDEGIRVSEFSLEESIIDRTGNTKFSRPLEISKA